MKENSYTSPSLRWPSIKEQKEYGFWAFPWVFVVLLILFVFLCNKYEPVKTSVDAFLFKSINFSATFSESPIFSFFFENYPFLLLVIVLLFVGKIKSAHKKKKVEEIKNSFICVMKPLAGLVSYPPHANKVYFYLYRKVPKGGIPSYLPSEPPRDFFPKTDAEPAWFFYLREREYKNAWSWYNKNKNIHRLPSNLYPISNYYYVSAPVRLDNLEKYVSGDLFKVYIDPHDPEHYFVHLEWVEGVTEIRV